MRLVPHILGERPLSAWLADRALLALVLAVAGALGLLKLAVAVLAVAMLLVGIVAVGGHNRLTPV
jgi:hypothetical protein